MALSASLLVGAKALTIGTPFLFKEAIDVLSTNDAIVAAPVAVLAGYGVARLGASGFQERATPFLRPLVSKRSAMSLLECIAICTRWTMRFI